jgi:hypothetical protein
MSPDSYWHAPQPIFSDILSNLALSGEIADLRNRVLSANTTDFVFSLLEEISFRIEICLDTQCKEDQYYYYLMRSYCKLCLDQTEESIQSAMYATDGFRLCGNVWAQIFGHWFLGAIYASQRRGYLFLAEINHALDLLEAIRQNSLVKGEYDIVSRCQVLMLQLRENKDKATKMGTGPLYLPGKTVPMSPPASFSPGYLLLPWLPRYHAVRGGSDGLIWSTPTKDNVSVIHSLEIDHEIYRLYGLRSMSAHDSQITLSENEKYGFAKVDGHSMNACHPTPICQGDYILFRLSNTPEDNEIVVASRPTPSAEFAYMVKRYYAAEKELRSETHEIQGDYSPVKLSPDHQILGVVIAVAKKEVT